MYADTPFPGTEVYISRILGIVPVEVDNVNFRYFDVAGNQLTNEQLKSMCIVTPAMEHIFATVVGRIEKSWKRDDKLESRIPKQYNKPVASR